MKLLIGLVVAFGAMTQAIGMGSMMGDNHCCSLMMAKSHGVVKHCMDTVWKDTANYLQDNTDVCQFCENVIGDVRKMLLNNASWEACQQYLDAACDLIPDETMAKQCKDTIDSTLEELHDMIDSELDPKAICAAIGLCTGFKQSEMHKMHHAMMQKAPSMDVVVDAEVTTASPPICADCEKFIQDLKDEVTDPATEDEVKTMLKMNLCTQLGTLKDECNALVDAYVPEIMDLLSQQIDPTVVCQALGVCAGGDPLMLVKMKLKKSPLYMHLQTSSAEDCLFCKTVLAEIQELDQNADIQKDIENFLKDNLCSKLGDYQATCETTVDAYGPVLFELIATELDPETRCKALGFCTQSTNKKAEKMTVPIPEVIDVAASIRQAMPASKPVKNIVKSVECELCQTLMEELDEMLEQNSTEAEIVAAIEKVCSLLPDTIALQCKDFIDEYGPAIVDLLVQELSPDVICSALGLCPGEAHKLVLAKVNQDLLPKKPASDEMCGVCETIIQYLDSILQENATVEEIENALKKVCNFLPSSYAQQCNDFVEQYGELIIDMIANELTPEEICQELGLCNAAKSAAVPFEVIQPVQAQLLGTNECTYGPAFWCVNVENAKKCNALEHCQQKVWNKN